MRSKDPFERAVGVAKKLGDKRRADEANKRTEEEKRKLAEKEKERKIELQAGKVRAWLKGEDSKKILKILFELGDEPKIPLGRIRLTTYRTVGDGTDGYGFDKYVDVDFREELREAFLYEGNGPFRGLSLELEVDVPNGKHYQGDAISEWCRESLERFPEKEPKGRLVEIVRAWVKKI